MNCKNSEVLSTVYFLLALHGLQLHYKSCCDNMILVYVQL